MISAVLGLIGIVFMLLSLKVLAIAGVVLAGLGFANIWPMLFAITIEEKPERSSELSGLMCMAISGGALVPLLMGKLIDSGLSTLAYIIPALCFAYLLLLSLKSKRQPTK
jgi:fucose permease